VRIPSNTSSASIALIEVSIKRGYLHSGQKRPHERHPDSIRSDQTGSSGSDDGGS